MFGCVCVFTVYSLGVLGKPAHNLFPTGHQPLEKGQQTSYATKTI